MPHESTAVLDAQLAPHAWNPESQLKPQLEPSQVAAPCAGTAQALHDVPQVITLVFETHVALHTCWPAPQSARQRPVVPSQPSAQLASCDA